MYLGFPKLLQLYVLFLEASVYAKKPEPSERLNGAKDEDEKAASRLISSPGTEKHPFIKICSA
jgi:hypothetical protein